MSFFPARIMNLDRRYLLGILIYTLVWKELEANSEETFTEENPENFEKDSKKKKQDDEANVLDSEKKKNSKPFKKNVEETTFKSNTDKTLLTDDDTNKEESELYQDENDLDGDVKNSVSEALPPWPKGRDNSKLMNNIKIILIMNLIILLIITLLIISILIYYVLVFNPESSGEKNYMNSDQQCFCENNRSCMSEC